MPSPRTSVLILSVLALLLWCAPTQAERRVALVIGNGAYKTAPLKNPTNDAQDIADALREMGFDVTLKINTSHKEMEEAVRAFGAKLKLGGLGLFYYAGHGVQVGGENYLIPVDTKIDAEADVKFGALNAGMTLARMEDAGNDMNIVILDACRTNPFARSFRTAEQGLARMDAPKGSLIAYATAPGRVAADSGSSGRNGVYTSFLLQHMREPGQKVEETLKRVRADVVRATKDKQVPWESSSLIGDFYFVIPTLQSTRPLGMAALPPVQTEVVVGDQGHPTGGPEALYERAYQLQQSKNFAESLALFTKAADQGYAKAQSMLGALYENGLYGVVQSRTEGMKWWLKVAEQGYAEAQSIVGSTYREGADGIVKDYAKAKFWLQKAAAQGEDYAQYALGEMYTNGQGVTKNSAEAAKWYKMSAERGNEEAMNKIWRIYASGNGVPVNDFLATKWLKILAEMGQEDAQCILGGAYKQGTVVNKDYVQAYKWYSIAAANSSKRGEKGRDSLTYQLTPAQRTEAQRLASQWRPKKPEELGLKANTVAGVGEEPMERGGSEVAATRKKDNTRQ